MPKMMHKILPRTPELYFLGILCLLFCAAGAAAQADSPKDSAKQTEVVNVNEVSLNLVVRAKNGKIVQDLKPEDISVTDGGVAVKISTLHFVSGSSGQHLVTLVFDRMDSASGHNAKDIAAKVLKMVPQDGFSFSVAKAEGRLMLYEDFTADRAALTHAIEQVVDIENTGAGHGAETAEKRLISVARTGADETGARVTPDQRLAAQTLLAALQDSQRIVQEQHTQPGLAGLLALSRAEQRIPGRKTILYFTQGLEGDASSGDRLRDVVGAANRAGVSIYAIDTTLLTAQADQTLVAMSAMGGARAAQAQAPPQAAFSSGGGGFQPVAAPPPGLAPMANNQYERYETQDPNGNVTPLASLGLGTGGGYVAAGGDIKKPLRRMIEDMTTYYEASYVPPIEKYDGQFRPIAVKPLRNGLKINSRAGYFALPPNSSQTIRPFEAPLLKMLADAQLPSDVAFRARVLRLGELSTGNENAVAIEVPMNSLESRDDVNSNLFSVHASVVGQIKNKAGVVIEHFGEDVPRHGALSAKNAAQAESIIVQRHFTAEPGEYVLEAVVFDQNSGKSGAQRIPFEIAAAPAGPWLGDLTMVQRIDPVPVEADPDEPMRYGNGKVMASAADRVPQGRKEISFFFMVHPDAQSSELPVLEMEVLKSGEPIAQVPLKLRKTTGEVAVPYLATIQAGGLPSGNYEVIERLTQGGRSVDRDLSFQIGNGEPADEKASNAAPGAAAGNNEPEITATGMQLPAGDARGAHRLVITSLPADAVTAPSADQLQAIISDARKRAVEYSKSLPNFICIEVTNRSVDQGGRGNWKPRDSIAEMLTYHDSEESRTTLEVNGRRSSLKRADLDSTWPLSVGEFGAMLNLVFQPTSKTEFEWKEAATLGDGSGTLQVLNYKVSAKNATIVLSQGNDDAAVGFHGLVYIDASTGGVRRVTLEADDVPHAFSVHAAGMTVDYDYVAISGRDYLLPVRSTVTLVKAHRKVELNEISFRNYRRFASRTKIKVLQ